MDFQDRGNHPNYRNPYRRDPTLSLRKSLPRLQLQVNSPHFRPRNTKTRKIQESVTDIYLYDSSFLHPAKEL